MKVIKDNYTTATKEITCKYCKSILAWSREDAKYNTDGVAYIICPLCNTTMRVDIDSLYKNTDK